MIGLGAGLAVLVVAFLTHSVASDGPSCWNTKSTLCCADKWPPLILCNNERCEPDIETNDTFQKLYYPE